MASASAASAAASASARSSSVLQLAVQREWWLSADSTRPATHVLMSGGKMHVPDGELETFHRALVMDARFGTRNTFVEVLTAPQFIMFVDLDFKTVAPDVLAGLDWMHMLSVIHRTVGVMWPGKAMHVSEVGEAPVLGTASASASLGHPGIHLVWPGAKASASKALAVTKYVRAALNDALPETEWKDIVDRAVFKGTGRAGLRMLFQTKWDRSPVGHDVGRAYVYVGEFDPLAKGLCPIPAGVRDEDKLHLMSVRLHTRFATIAPSAALGVGVGGVKRSRRAVPDHGEVGAVSAMDQRHCAVETFVRDRFFGGDASVRITLKVSRGTAYVAFTNVRMCANHGAAHQRATQYFSISKTGGVVQKCACRCPDKTCGAWTGSKVAAKDLGPTLHRLLFPKVTDADEVHLETLSRARQGMDGDQMMAAVASVQDLIQRRRKQPQTRR